MRGKIRLFLAGRDMLIGQVIDAKASYAILRQPRSVEISQGRTEKEVSVNFKRIAFLKNGGKYRMSLTNVDIVEPEEELLAGYKRSVSGVSIVQPKGLVTV